MTVYSVSRLQDPVVSYTSEPQGKNQENIYILYASFKNKINFTAFFQMCRLIQFLYSGTRLFFFFSFSLGRVYICFSI